MTIFVTLAEVECMYNVTLQDTKLIDGVNTPLKNRYYQFSNRLVVELPTGWVVMYDTLINREMLRKHCWHTGETGLVTTRHRNTDKNWDQMLMEYDNNKQTTKFTIQFYT